jgi:capsular exopolysaccharide synthesis family protein
MDQNLKFQEFSIKDYIFIVRLHLKKIISFVVVGFIVGLYFNLVTPPAHVASASVILSEKPGTSMVMDFSGNRGQDRMSNAIQMIKSRGIALETVKTLWPEYKNNLELFGSYPFYPRGRRLRMYFKNIFKFGREKVTEKRMFYEEPYSEKIGNKFAAIIENKINVYHVPNTDIIKISYTSVWAAEARLIVNTLTQNYKKFEKEINAEEGINAANFLENLVKEQFNNLAKAEEAINDFQNKHQIYHENSQSDLLSSSIIDLENQIVQNKIKIKINSEKVDFFRSQLTDEESKISKKVSNTLDIQVTGLRSSIGALEQEKLVNSLQYGSQHEAVNQLDNQILALKGQLDKKILELVSEGLEITDPLASRQDLIAQIINVGLEQDMLNFNIRESMEMIKSFRKKLNSLPPIRLEYLKLKRNRDLIIDNYTRFRSKLEDVKISNASRVGTVQILDLAPLPNKNINDNNRDILMGILFGMAAGFILAFGLEFFDSSVKSIYDIEKHNLSVLGVIPAMDSTDVNNSSLFKSLTLKDKNQNKSGGRQLITLDNPKSPISEAYRSLRTSLVYSDGEDKVKSILVSSAGPGDGKTTTVANLAITLANMGKKTILIDTDLRRPVVNKVFNVKKSPGITEFLTGHVEKFSDTIVKTSVENLYVVPSGIVPPNPSELLGSKKLVNLIKELESKWDMVLFDSPPLVAVTDATMVSKEIDKIIIVVKVGRTDNKAFEHTIGALKKVSAPIGGIVLNAVTESHNYGGYYYYYQYYHYYGSENA